MLSNAGEAERKSGTRDNTVAIGVQAAEKTIRWLYDQHLAALVGDTVAFEAWPPKFTDGWCLHEWLLVHWGTWLLTFCEVDAMLMRNRNPDRRNVGPRGFERAMPCLGPTHLLHDQRAVACQGWYR
jgi:hypothetical protein